MCFSRLLVLKFSLLVIPLPTAISVEKLTVVEGKLSVDPSPVGCNSVVELTERLGKNSELLIEEDSSKNVLELKTFK